MAPVCADGAFAVVLGGEEWAQAQAEVGRIEVEIARIERAMDPPQV